jgi:ethanolaminephosphotransferase
VDLVPTLSLLFGLPIPKNSLGVLIPELFDGGVIAPLEEGSSVLILLVSLFR